MTMQEQPASRIAISPVDPNASVLEHALSYGRDGFRVVFVWAPVFGKDLEPSEEFTEATGCTCGSGGDCSIGKHPIGAAWEKNSTHVENKIRDRYLSFKQRPNVGIQLGPQADGTYIVAIDVDEEERFRVLSADLGELPETARCDSGIGYRLFYTLPPEIDASSIQNVNGIDGEKGVDAKADRGQVVVAPSFHRNGRRYKWTRYGDISVLPLAWALKLIKREPPKWVHEYTPISLRTDKKAARKAIRYLETAVTNDCTALAACKTGARNSTLYHMAVSLFSLCAGMSQSEAVPRIHDNLASAAKQAGLNDREIYKTLRSADTFVASTGAWRVPRVLADPASGAAAGGGSVPPADGSAPSQPVLPATGQPRPTIRLSSEIHINVDESIEALRAEENLYQRDGYLVHITKVTHEESENSPAVTDEAGNTRRALVLGTPQIRQLSVATLREKMTRVAVFQKFENKSSSWKQTTPTDQVVTAVHARGEWNKIRPLIGITEAPTMRPDGSIVQEAGYDRVTRYLYDPSTRFGIVQASPSQEDARAAFVSLSEAFADFPYLNDSHRSVPVAAILTLIARPAIVGAIPGFLFDASTRGSGKTLQTDAIAIVATGRGAPRMNFPNNEEEMEKVLGAYALRGAPFFSLDNVPSHRPFGGGPLDRVLTARDTVDLRVLGRSEVPTLEWRAMIMATGNNIQIFADTARRVLLARLEPKDEHPERRINFKHEDLLGWVRKERPRLVVAALTLLRAWVVAGRPKMRCARWGSFEEWSSFIPHAIVFAGGADPMLARPANDADVDTDTRAFTFILTELRRLKWQNFKISYLLERIYQPIPLPRDGDPPSVDTYAEFREAIETICPIKNGKRPDARVVGNKFRTYKGRYIDQHRLISIPGRGGVELWQIEGPDAPPIQGSST